MAEQQPKALPSPLLIPTIAWIFGIGLGARFQLPVSLLLCTFTLFILIAFKFRFKLFVLIPLIILCGIIRITVSSQKPISTFLSVLSQKGSVTQICEGKVIRVLNNEHNRYLVELTSFNHKTIKEKAYLFTTEKLTPNDHFSVLARLNYLPFDPVLDTYNSLSYHRNLKAKISIQPVYKFYSIEKGKELSLQKWRYLLLNKLDRKLGVGAGFGKALLFGDRTDDPEWIEQLIKGGLLHLIAISGLHVFYIYFILITILNIWLPKRWSEAVFLLIILVYAALCNWSPPVMRAIVMIVLYLMAKWVQRPVSPLQIISLSLLIITMVDPFSLFSIGLQLSYLCVLVMVYALPHWKINTEGMSIGKTYSLKVVMSLVDILVSSSIISLIVLPLSLFHFQRGSLNGIIGNIVGIPLISLLLPLTFLLLIIPSQWLIFAWFKASFDGLFYLFQNWVAWTANLPLYIDSVSISILMLIGLYVLVLSIVLRFRNSNYNKWIFYAQLCLAILLIIWSMFPPKKSFTIICFNAGMGDCSYIECADGRNIMIDTGPKIYKTNLSEQQSWFSKRGYPWFKNRKIDELDILIITHLHDDHAGGIQDVCKTMKVNHLFISRFAAQSKYWQKLAQSNIFKRTAVHILSDTLSFSFSQLKLSILHPSRLFSSLDENAKSLVVRVDYKNFSALFAGDIDQKTEQYLIEEIPEKLDCHLLKAPHHGSRNSNSLAFIKAVSPQVVCITASRNNRFGFPHKQTLLRYEKMGIKPQITAYGSIQINP